MAQQLLDSPDVLSPFQQVCGKLHQVGIRILSALLTRCGILPVLVLRKHPLPAVIGASSHRNVYPLGAR